MGSNSEEENGDKRYRFLGPVYRHTDQEAFAQDFVSGKTIWISTFTKCRAYEDSEQGDKGEGSSVYSHSPISNSSSDFNIVAARLGVRGSGELTMSGNKVFTTIPDAYLLCLSFRKFDGPLQKKFGNYCITIPNIHDFALQLVSEMARIVPVIGATYGLVDYRDREYRDTEMAPVIPFVKPIVPFKAQREVRIVVSCEPGHEYKPFGVSIRKHNSPIKYEKLTP